MTRFIYLDCMEKQAVVILLGSETHNWLTAGTNHTKSCRFLSLFDCIFEV